MIPEQRTPFFAPDHSRVAGTLLIVLGVLQLLGLNVGGLLFIWFGNRVRGRREGFRKASLCILGLYLAAILFVVVWATVIGTKAMTASVFGAEWPGPPLWLVYTLSLLLLVLFGLPFWWLSQDSYRDWSSKSPN